MSMRILAALAVVALVGAVCVQAGPLTAAVKNGRLQNAAPSHKNPAGGLMSILKGIGDSLKPGAETFGSRDPDPAQNNKARNADEERLQNMGNLRSNNLALLEVASKTQGKLPPYDGLPSMLPNDGLNIDMVEGPPSLDSLSLKNPVDDLPSPSSLVPKVASLDQPTSFGTLIHTPAETLPPLVGGLNTPGKDDSLPYGSVTVPTAQNIELHPAPSQDKLDNVGPQVGDAPRFREVLQTNKAKEDKSTSPAMLPPPNPSWTAPGDSHVGSGKSYYDFMKAKKDAEAAQKKFMDKMKRRQAIIKRYQTYVDGGEAWINKMEAQLEAWLQEERQRGSTSINKEKTQVKKYKDALNKLLLVQKKDAAVVNTYNAKMRKAEIIYRAEQSKKRLQLQLEQDKALKGQLASSAKRQAAIKQELATINAELAKVSSGAAAPVPTAPGAAPATTAAGAAPAAAGPGGANAPPASAPSASVSSSAAAPA